MSDEQWAQLVNEAQYIAQFQALMAATELEKLLVRTGILTRKE